MALSVDDIRKKLQEDLNWEPTSEETEGDSEFWTKFDEAMDSLHVKSDPSDKEEDDEDFEWDDDDGEDW